MSRGAFDAAKGVFFDGGGLYGTVHWPEVTVISTVRQISTDPEAPGD